MEIEKQIVIIPTHHTAPLWLSKGNTLTAWNVKRSNNPKLGTCQHLYIISNEEIKQGDWYYLPRTKNIHQCQSKEGAEELNLERRVGVRKVVASTDKEFTPNSWIDRELIVVYITAWNNIVPLEKVWFEAKCFNNATGKEIEDDGYVDNFTNGELKTRKDGSIIVGNNNPEFFKVCKAKREYITPARAASLENSIAWLSTYEPDENKTHVVGESIREEEEDHERTKLLKELGKINLRRKEIITLITKTGYAIEPYDENQWQSVFPENESEKSQLHSSRNEAFTYMTEECGVKKGQIIDL